MCSSLSNIRIKTLGERLDKIVGVRRNHCGLYRLLRRAWGAIGNVLGNRAGEECGLLADNANLIAVPLDIQLPYVNTFEFNGALDRIIEALYQANGRGFASTAWSNKGQSLHGVEEGNAL